MHYKLSRLIIYILMVCCHLNTANISTSSGYSIYKQWGDIINKLMLFCIQYTIKLTWIWFPCPSAINNRRWPTALLHIKDLKILINQYKSKSFEIQPFLDITKYQPSGISSLIHHVFIYLSLNIKIGTITSPATLMHLISIIHSCFPAITLYFYILSRCISIFITYSSPMPNPDSSIFHIFKRL